ncbi:MAG: rhodanese-like domain-containing protein [Thermodesulfobacteriota bacterium]
MKTVIFGSILILMQLLSTVAFSQESPRISKEELKTMLGDPNVIILDVRIDDEWNASEKKIPGATWKNPEEIGSWLKQYPKSKTLVFYCS